jgi:hypothetical protein
MSEAGTQPGDREARSFVRPKFILILLIMFEAFLLLLLCSPGVLRSKRQVSAAYAWMRAPSPETEQAYDTERDNDRRRQYVVFGGVVAVGIAILVYGAFQRTPNQNQR